jgi:hypothetical protein
MKIHDAVGQLSSETGLALRLGTVYSLEEDDSITGTEIYKSGKLYGKIILGTNREGHLVKCAYEGFYPGAEKPIHLELASLRISLNEKSQVRRIDKNPIIFLGYPQDGWFAKQNENLRSSLRGPGNEYLRRLRVIIKTLGLQETISNLKKKTI